MEFWTKIDDKTIIFRNTSIIRINEKNDGQCKKNEI